MSINTDKEENLEVPNTQLPTAAELEKAVKTAKTGKACGPDGILVE